MSKIYESALELIGQTPILKLNAYSKKAGISGVNILGKLEYLNPAGSVKDRIALAMIEDAEKKGLIKKGATIIEPTSGNTGIGLAAVAAAKGYKAILTLPDTMSVERRNLLKAYGAQLVLTRYWDRVPLRFYYRLNKFLKVHGTQIRIILSLQTDLSDLFYQIL